MEKEHEECICTIYALKLNCNSLEILIESKFTVLIRRLNISQYSYYQTHTVTHTWVRMPLLKCPTSLPIFLVEE